MKLFQLLLTLLLFTFLSCSKKDNTSSIGHFTSLGSAKLLKPTNAAIVTVGDTLFIVGGSRVNTDEYTKANYLDTIEIFDLKNLKAIPSSGLKLNKPRTFAQAITVNGKIFVIGGVDEDLSKGFVSKTVDVIDIKTLKLENHFDLNEGAKRAAIQVAGDSIYIMGGEFSANSATNSIKIINIKSQSQVNSPTNFKLSKSCFFNTIFNTTNAADVLGDTIFIHGGDYNNGPFLDILDVKNLKHVIPNPALPIVSNGFYGTSIKTIGKKLFSITNSTIDIIDAINLKFIKRLEMSDLGLTMGVIDSKIFMRSNNQFKVIDANNFNIYTIPYPANINSDDKLFIAGNKLIAFSQDGISVFQWTK